MFKSSSYFHVDNDLRILHLAFLLVAYCFFFWDGPPYVSHAGLGLGVAFVVLGWFRAYFALLVAMGGWLTYNLAVNFLILPNDATVIIYLVVLMAVGVLFGQDRRYYSKYAAVLFAVVMGFAFLQKLMSENYMNGGLMLSWLSMGRMFSYPISLIDPNWIDATKAFTEQHILNTNPDTNPVGLERWGYLHILAIIMTYFSLALQLGTEATVIFRKKVEWLVGPAILIFVMSVHAVTYEPTFLGMSLLMGFLMIDRERYRVVYWLFIAAILYMCITNLIAFKFFFLW